MTSAQRVTTTLRSHFCGWPGSWQGTQTLILWQCLHFFHQKFRWIQVWPASMRTTWWYVYRGIVLIILYSHFHCFISTKTSVDCHLVRPRLYGLMYWSLSVCTTTAISTSTVTFDLLDITNFFEIANSESLA